MVQESSNNFGILPRKKVLLVGNEGCGKTSLLRTIAGLKPSSSHMPTILQTTIVQATVPGRTLPLVELATWEIGGSEEASQLLPLSVPSADVAAICYSTDDASSLLHARQFWATKLRMLNPQLPIVLVGCKSDLRDTEGEEISPASKSDKKGNREKKEIEEEKENRLFRRGAVWKRNKQEQKPWLAKKKADSCSQEGLSQGVSADVGERFASKIGAKLFLECSSNDQKTVEEVFYEIGRLSLKTGYV